MSPAERKFCGAFRIQEVQGAPANPSSPKTKSPAKAGTYLACGELITHFRIEICPGQSESSLWLAEIAGFTVCALLDFDKVVTILNPGGLILGFEKIQRHVPYR